MKKINLNEKKNYKVILTGGYAELFKNYLSTKPIVDQDITVKGIIKMYKKLLS